MNIYEEFINSLPWRMRYRELHPQDTAAFQDSFLFSYYILYWIYQFKEEDAISESISIGLEAARAESIRRQA